MFLKTSALPSGRMGAEEEWQRLRGQAAAHASDSEEGGLMEYPREASRVSEPPAGGLSRLPQPGKSALHPASVSMPVMSVVSGGGG